MVDQNTCADLLIESIDIITYRRSTLTMVLNHNIMNQYQYDIDVLVGSEGDVWININNRTSIDLTNISGLTYGEIRANYQRISNLPPIRKVVRVVNNSISVITRDNRYIMIDASSSGESITRITDGITDAYVVNKGNLIYLTTDSELKLSKNLSRLDNSISIRNDINSIHPLKLRSASNQHPLDINAILIRYDRYDAILEPHHEYGGWTNTQVVKVFMNDEAIHDIINIYLDMILTKNSVISLSLDNRRNLVMETTPINIMNVEDVVMLQSQVCILANGIIYRLDGTPLIRDVGRIIKFIEYSLDQFFITNRGDNVYIMTSQLEEVDIPLVLS